MIRRNISGFVKVALLLTIFFSSALPLTFNGSPVLLAGKPLFTTSVVSAQALASNTTTPASLQQATFSLNSYAPAQIVISYAYTSSFNISKVSSVGLSLYKIISGPTSITFQASDVDTYHFSVDINYGNILVEQTIQIASFSGTLAPDGTSFTVKANEVRFDFTLTVTKQPTYPSVNDVAQAVVLQVSQQLQQYQVKQDAFIAAISDTILTIGAIAAVAFALVIALILFMFWIHRKVVRLEEHGV
jgi:hypothetical protein